MSDVITSDATSAERMSFDPATDRHIRLAGTRNLRDVGGYAAGEGRRTRWRTLYRADALDRVPLASSELSGLGIRRAIDLRWPHEVESSPSVFRGSRDVDYVSIPLLDDLASQPDTPPQVYRRILDRRGRQLAAVARALAQTGALPAVIGCAAGVDRTGVTVAVILSAIGVSAAAIATDYAMSAACFTADGAQIEADDWRSGSVVIDCPPAYMEQTLAHLERRHGGAAALLERHGFGSADLARLQEALTEPMPTRASRRSASTLRSTSGARGASPACIANRRR